MRLTSEPSFSRPDCSQSSCAEIEDNETFDAPGQSQLVFGQGCVVKYLPNECMCRSISRSSLSCTRNPRGSI